VPEKKLEHPHRFEVLLVEDSGADALLVKGLLRRTHKDSFSVTHVTTLREAIDLLDRMHFAIVILDLGLPDSTGLDTLRAIRTHTTNVAVLVLTATDDEELGTTAINEGAQDYIPKGHLQPHLFARSVRYAMDRHRSAVAVQESSALLSRVIDSAVDGIVTKNINGIITSWNPGAERLFGYAPQEAIGQSILLLIPPDRADEEHLILTRIRRGETVEPFETVRLRKGGVPVHVSVTISPIRDDQGKIVGASKIARDITEQKRAEQSLRASERQLRQFIEEAPVAVAMFNKEMQYLATSRRWTEQYGKGNRSLIGMDHYELHPGLPERWKEYHRRGLAGELLRDDEDHWVQEDGAEQWIRWAIHPWHEPSGSIGGIIMSAEDITRRKVVEDTLKRQASLLDQAYDAVFVWERNGTITFWNKGAEYVYGYPKEQAIGQSSHDLLKTSSHTLDPALVSLAVRGRWEGELEHTRSDGKCLMVESRMVEISEDNRCFVLEINRDVSARKQLEEQLRQSQKMEAIGQLAGGVAHDFNNLLGVILGMTEILSETSDLKKTRKGLAEIRKAGQRAANLTRQLLAFGRKQLLEPKILDLNDAIAEMTNMLRRLVGENILIGSCLGSALWRVRVDPGQVEQIVLNLVVNARDAMPNGGSITIETQNVQLDEAYARSHVTVAPGRYVMLAVSDSGSGMDAETQKRIFEPFFTTKKSGSGLGLATVYGAVKQSGGHVWLYSEPGEGTTFKIYFPEAAESVENHQAEERDAPATNQATETILLVEDSESLLAVTREFLQLAGYNVVEACNGKEALKLARAHVSPIHLLLTDVVMPEMSGKTLADEVSRIHPETRILYMSGYTANAIVHHGVLDEGVNLLSKPFSRASLTKKIREVLSYSRVL
jgi:two-component system, cell cycle sensor histidine kinase and response regulator CckA